MSVVLAKWTLDDYHRMTAAGILDGRSVELLNGEIVTMAPEGPEHAFLGDEGGDYLSELLGKRAKVREGRPVTLPNQSEPEPDLAVVRPLGDIYRQRHPYAEDVFWVIEFSNTSLAKDLEAKRRAYAAASIPEYWVVNLQERNIVILRQPEQGDYQAQQVLSRGDIQLVAFPDVTVSIARILGEL
ncbi:Uma2 family endonuclease [Leptothoe sp. PORK10 BA2]|uniref:Uma2 family endonuclease n=1 Tax=Leptothoe sp. PORK10 BA2 TaxID=3110254 RepID=UPI002B216050|nr:Uma2 family endonuclease [Leptothoe sp. PORK10 BA2]MEA5462889.1 Uma2 family endonuclease [Leptothoe sp. PORK10 BA2]